MSISRDYVFIALPLNEVVDLLSYLPDRLIGGFLRDVLETLESVIVFTILTLSLF